MKVLLRKRIRKLGTIGDIVDVKSGYARNYLIPQGLGIVPTEINIKQVEREKDQYLAQLELEKADLLVRANLLSGKEITITARANNVGHLYGSIGPAQIAHAMTKMELQVSPEEILLNEPIRTLDKYDVTIELDDDIRATVHVWIVPTHDPDLDEILGDNQPQPAEGGEESDGDADEGAIDGDDQEAPVVSPEVDESHEETPETVQESEDSEPTVQESEDSEPTEQEIQ